MKLNVVYPEAIDSYLLEVADGDEKLGSYLCIALKNAMMKEPTLFTQLREYPEDAPAWLTRQKFESGTYHIFSPEKANSMRGDLRHVADWIGGAIKEGDAWIENTDALGRPIRLLQIGSLQKAQDMADKDMRAKANNLRSRFANASSLFEEDEAAGHIETVKIFDDGSRIVRMLTPHALDIESAHLGHCIGNGGYDNALRSENLFYYSLRDPLNKAHATFEVKNGRLLQLRGKENAPPAEKYMGKALEFIRENGWDLAEGISNTGLLHKDGEYYDIRNLPHGFSWDDKLVLQDIAWLRGLSGGISINFDLNIQKCPKFAFIGDNVSVGWYLDLKYCESVIRIGDNVSVGGGLILESCFGLKSIGKNTSVGFRADLERCISLISLGENFSVGEDLILRKCTSLTSLPDNLRVVGNVWAESLPVLTSIGKNLSVGSSLHLQGCKALTSIGENLSVGSSLHLWDCRALTSIGENLSVGGDLDLTGCTALTALPENMMVGGRLNLIGCISLTSLPQNFFAKEIVWRGEEYNSVDEFRAAFEAVHPPKQSALPPIQSQASPSVLPM